MAARFSAFAHDLPRSRLDVDFSSENIFRGFPRKKKEETTLAMDHVGWPHSFVVPTNIDWPEAQALSFRV